MRKKLINLFALSLVSSALAIPLALHNGFENVNAADNLAPKITIELPDEPCYAGIEYVFGPINCVDDVDGVITNWTYTLLNVNSKDISYAANKIDDYHLSFTPSAEGTYTLTVFAKDSSGNEGSKKSRVKALHRPHFPVFKNTSFKKDARNNEKYYFPIPKAVDNTYDEFEPDNDITFQYSGYFFDSSNNKINLNIYLDEPENPETSKRYFVPSEYSSYKTDGVGNYFLTISASNSFGTSNLDAEIWVKYALNGEEAIKTSNLVKSSNWGSEGGNTFSKTGVTLSKPAYYKGGLSLEDGVEIDIDVENLPDNTGGGNWMSINLTTHPGNSCIYSERIPGLHIMVFKKSGSFYANVRYCNEDMTTFDIVSDVALVSIGNKLSIKLKPFDVSLDPERTDNVSLFLNKSQVESYDIYKIERSVLEDDEGFVYFSFTNFNTSVIKINSILDSDYTAPVISLNSSISKQQNINQLIKLPTATAKDDRDGVIEANLLSVKKPNGKKITVINNTFTPTEVGSYLIAYSSTDASGNTAVLQFELTMVDPNVDPSELSGQQKTIIIVSLIIGLAISGGVISLYALSLKRKGKMNDTNKK